MVNLRHQWKLYRIKRELRRYSPEHQRWILERAMDPRPLKPIPERTWPKCPKCGEPIKHWMGCEACGKEIV